MIQMQQLTMTHVFMKNEFRLQTQLLLREMVKLIYHGMPQEMKVAQQVVMMVAILVHVQKHLQYLDLIQMALMVNVGQMVQVIFIFIGKVDV